VIKLAATNQIHTAGKEVAHPERELVAEV